jgi:hypothetical protein
MELTGDRLKELVGECETSICCPGWWQELADLINEETKKDPENWRETGSKVEQ